MINGRRLLLKGILVLNAFLVPLAALGLYLAYMGRSSGDKTSFVAGVVLAATAPLLAYLAAAPIVSRLEKR